MVVEIPKETKAKPSNPFAQGLSWAHLLEFMLTWDDPNEEHPELEVFGDE